MSLALGVNIDHIATLRQARRASFPDPLAFATLALACGADYIVAHLRRAPAPYTLPAPFLFLLCD